MPLPPGDPRPDRVQQNRVQQDRVQQDREQQDREQEVPRSDDIARDRGAAVSIQTELSRVVSELRRSIPELNGAMVASVDGLSVAHDFPEPDAERMAAMAATALGLGKRISDRTGLGEMQETVVR
nr:roadblock/LC7 domain-containing protein [Micromonospora sp. DSM 115978]